MLLLPSISIFFFFNDTATTEIYTLSLHDALPISWRTSSRASSASWRSSGSTSGPGSRSEEHTSELQSRLHLVCRLLLEKKKKKNKYNRGSNEKEYRSGDTRSYRAASAARKTRDGH